MATILNILSSNYLAAGMNVASTSKYVDVDPKKFQGSWTGKYSDNASFSFQISNVSGYKATVKYQSGSSGGAYHWTWVNCDLWRCKTPSSAR